MDRLKQKNELFVEMNKKYDAYLEIEGELKREPDLKKRVTLIGKLNQARDQWLIALKAFREHLNRMNDTNE